MTVQPPLSMVAVLSNPPTTSGNRTLARVEQAREILGATRVEVVNLFPLPTYRVTGIADVGTVELDWLAARPVIGRALRNADIAVLAYGTRPPTGPARMLQRDQVTWLRDQLVEFGIPAYVVGNAPRHPSRWQRYTSRVHPELPFYEALPLSMNRIDVSLPD